MDIKTFVGTKVLLIVLKENEVISGTLPATTKAVREIY
jgi:hypothetical protein